MEKPAGPKMVGKIDLSTSGTGQAQAEEPPDRAPRSRSGTTKVGKRPPESLPPRLWTSLWTK